MINLKTIEQIQQASVAERIQIIELILQSLKYDMQINLAGEKSKFKLFKVRQFNLGKEVRVNRDVVYAERGV